MQWFRHIMCRSDKIIKAVLSWNLENNGLETPRMPGEKMDGCGQGRFKNDRSKE